MSRFPLTAMKLQRIRDASAGTTGESAMAGSILLLVFCTIFVLGRAYSRLFILDSCWGRDDTWITGAWLATLVSTVLFCIKISYGATANTSGYELSYGGIICYQVGISLTKVSILFFYLRILPQGKYRLLTWITMAFVICFSIPLFIASTLACHPESGKFFFNPSITCVPFLPLLYTGASLHGVANTWLIVFIIPCILKLQLSQKQKIALMVVMSAGILVIIAGIIRVIYIAETMQKPIYEWNRLLFGIWTSVELCVGIFCASAPATLPLLRRLAPHAMASLTGSTTLSHGYGNGIGNPRMRAREGAIELHSISDPPIITSGAKTSKPRHLLKKGFYSGENAGNESQEQVLANIMHAGIMKTSEITVSETRVDSDEDTNDVERRKLGTA